jgi:hypothetical protein
VAKNLPARPNLDHLRRQAKSLLSDLKDGNRAAAQRFIDHLPAAKRMSLAKVRGAGFRLADAQSVVARKSGFSAWPSLAHHVQDLRGARGRVALRAPRSRRHRDADRGVFDVAPAHRW